MNKKWLILFLMLILSPLISAQELLCDDIPDELIKNATESNIHTKYNYESFVKIPVKLKIINEILTEKDVYEGQSVKFRVVKDVFDSKNLYIRRGTILESKVKVIVTPGMNGSPASIVLGDFSIAGLDSGIFTGNYEVYGQDRSLLVFPLKWALTILPPTGSLTNFIKGGHAKIKSEKLITIYYYPEWL